MEPTLLGDLEFARLEAARQHSSVASLSTLTSQLATRRNRFVWPLLFVSLSVYFALLISVLYLPSLMAITFYDDINIGLLAIFLQVVLAIATFWFYCAWAARIYDPAAAVLMRAAQSASEGVKNA